MSYNIKINVFEGPYDLLLFLIKSGEIDIYDIPIAKITREYLEYIELMQSFNLEIAGEFIVMAATLMRIKSRMLLPVFAEDDEEIEDPRRELVQNILEYQRIKNAAGQFEKLERNRSEHFTRGKFDDQKELEVESEQYDMQMTVYELVVVFNDIFEKKKKEEIFHIVEPEPYTVEEKMDDILELVNTQKKISFLEYLRNIGDVLTVVINFLAILELVKRHLIVVSQAQPFKEIWISKNTQ